MRGSYGDGMFSILTVSMSILRLSSCTIILQDVTIRRNCIEHMGPLYCFLHLHVYL